MIYKNPNCVPGSIIKISEDSFVTIINHAYCGAKGTTYDQEVIEWYFQQDNDTIELLTKKYIRNESLLTEGYPWSTHGPWISPRILMMSEKRLIVSDLINEGYKNSIIVSIDLETDEKRYYSFVYQVEKQTPGKTGYEQICYHTIINNYLFVTMRNGYEESKKFHVVLDVETLEVVWIPQITVDCKVNEENKVKDLTDCNLMIVHIKDNLIAIISSLVPGRMETDGGSETKIIIVDMTDRSFTQTQVIDIDNEKIRTATNYANGLITINYLSEMKCYELC